MSTGEAFKGIPQQVAVNRTLHSLASIVESESGELSVIVQPLDGMKLIRGEYHPVGNKLQFPTKWGKKEGAIYLVEHKIAQQEAIIAQAAEELEKLKACLVRTKDINY